MTNHDAPQTQTNEDIIEGILKKFQEAKDENYAFGIIAENLFSWLIHYKKGEDIPDEIWEMLQQLSNNVDKDPTGKLVFSKSQLSVMRIINLAMKKGGIVISIPDKDSTNQKLTSSLEGLSYSKLLENAFFPYVLEKCGEDVDPFYFLSIIAKGINKALEILQENNGYSFGIQVTVTLYYPVALISTFWENPEVVKYLTEFHAKIYNG